MLKFNEWRHILTLLSFHVPSVLIRTNILDMVRVIIEAVYLHLFLTLRAEFSGEMTFGDNWHRTLSPKIPINGLNRKPCSDDDDSQENHSDQVSGYNPSLSKGGQHPNDSVAAHIGDLGENRLHVSPVAARFRVSQGFDMGHFQGNPLNICFSQHPRQEVAGMVWVAQFPVGVEVNRRPVNPISRLR